MLLYIRIRQQAVVEHGFDPTGGTNSWISEFEDSLVYPPRESSKPARLHRDLVSKKQKEEVAGVPHSGQSAGYL